jgi:hypothetical protein
MIWVGDYIPYIPLPEIEDEGGRLDTVAVMCREETSLDIYSLYAPPSRQTRSGVHLQLGAQRPTGDGDHCRGLQRPLQLGRPLAGRRAGTRGGGVTAGQPDRRGQRTRSAPADEASDKWEVRT